VKINRLTRQFFYKITKNSVSTLLHNASFVF